MGLPEHIEKFAVQSVRLNTTQQQSLLHWLAEESATKEDITQKRKHPRFAFKQLMEIVVLVRHPGGTIGTFRVPSRDLSNGGVGFLHGSFIYSGTACLAILTSLEGDLVKVAGKVVRCQHISGQVHGIGVEFDSPIVAEQFIEYSQAGTDIDQPQAKAANE